MHIVVASDVDRYVAEAILARWESVRTLGLPTGQTPEGIYGWLVQYFYEGRLSFSSKTTFNLDENLGMAPNDPESYRGTMQRLLVQYVDLPAGQFRVPPGLTTDVEGACAAYEADIAAAGGLDLCILGIGVNGHVAFNEPGSPKASRTRRVTIADTTRARFAASSGIDADRAPREGLTIGMATILEARELLLVAKGPAKAQAVGRAVLGPQTSELPASFLQAHPRCTFVADRAAAEEVLLKIGDAGGTVRSTDDRAHEVKVLD